MSTDRFMNLAQEISEQLKVVPKTNEYRLKIKKLESKFKSTVIRLGQVYPTATPGSSELTVLLAGLDNVDASLAKIQTDVNHDTGELRNLIQTSVEVIEALKDAAARLQKDPEAIMSAREMYNDKQTLYQVGYVNMWVKIVLCFLLMLFMYKSFGYTVIFYICVVSFYALVQLLIYLFSKYPKSTSLTGTTPETPVDCGSTQYGCCEWDGTVARVDRQGSNCPARQLECPASVPSTTPS